MLTSTLRSRIKTVLQPFAGNRYAGLAAWLTYHRIAPNDYRPEEFSPNLSLFVTMDQFDRQMRYVSENFNCIGIDEMIQKLRTGTVEPRSLVVTFDDGHRDNLELALPILKKYGVPAVIYVTTGFIGKTIRSFWWYDHELIVRKLDRIKLEWRGKVVSWRTSGRRAKENAFFELNSIFKSASPEEQIKWMRQLREQAGVLEESQTTDALSWEDLISLDREPLVTIGAHSVSHAVLSQLDPSALRQEMSESKRTLEHKLGHPVAHFAYPFGSNKHAAKREFETARECGFESACTTRIGHIQKFHAHHLQSLPRMTVDYHDNLESFGWKLSGLECLIKRPWSRFIAD